MGNFGIAVIGIVAVMFILVFGTPFIASTSSSQAAVAAFNEREAMRKLNQESASF